MGGMQSRRRDSYNQTAPDEYGKTYIEEALESNAFKDKPVGANPSATKKISLSARSAKPRQKRQKRDSTLSIRNPRTILPIKEENAASQDMTDTATDQHTARIFPSYTELRDSMRRKSTVKPQHVSENFEMKVQSNLIRPKRECKESTKETCLDSLGPTLILDDIDNDGRNINGCEQTFNQLNYYSGPSDDHSAPLTKFSYSMPKEYYYL